MLGMEPMCFVPDRFTKAMAARKAAAIRQVESMSDRRFPPPWTVESIPGGYKVKDANGQQG